MAVVSAAGANQRLDMSDPSLVTFFSNLITQPSFFGFLAQGGGESFVQFFGSALTYSGQELSGGTITGFELDVGYDEVILAPELSISGLSGLTPTAIDKDSAASIWREVLKGKDSFNLTGLDQNVVGLGLNIVFGDDLEHRSGAPAVEDKGARDRFQIGDNTFELSGDVTLVTGLSTQVMRYIGGGDRIVSGGVAQGVTDRQISVAGDAGVVWDYGFLRGGADRITYLDFSGEARIGGDALRLLSDARINGGADTILIDATPGASFITIGGDVLFMEGNNATLNGGNDIIRVSGHGCFVGGDVYSFGPDANGELNGGDDQIFGSAVDDRLAGEAVSFAFGMFVAIAGGDDAIDGGAGDDEIYGETGFETAQISGGDDTLHGGRENDLVHGQTGDDRLFGDDGKDTLNGQTGADGLDGGDGADLLFGHEAADTIDGGGGRDVITGAAGVDQMNGGDDRDVFAYLLLTDSGAAPGARDLISGFTHLLDRIDVAAIDAKSGGTDDAFKFIGSAGFKKPGQIRATQDGADTLVELNTEGAGGAEMAILLTGFAANTLTALDFVL